MHNLRGFSKGTKKNHVLVHCKYYWSKNKKQCIRSKTMAIVNNVKETLHRIRVKLYPNYLPKYEGTFIARTNSEASLSIEQVCAALKNRGGFTGKYEDLIEHIKQFFDEAAYQLCDGFAVNTGYFSIHPNVGGIFESAGQPADEKKHPVSFRFRTRSRLRKLAGHIAVEVEGLADGSGYIDEFIDISEETSNSIFVPGNQFVIHGHKIKIAGDDPSCGLYFVPVENPSKAVKVQPLAENSSSKLIGIAPATGFMLNKIEVRTQFTGSGSTTLKNIRVITGGFTIEEA
jgi:hypothetical protein